MLRALLLIVALLAPHQAIAAGPGPSSDLMWALMTWASPRLALPVPERLPTVALVSLCDVRKAMGRPEECGQEEGAQAAYFHDEKIIFLQKTWSPRNAYDVSTLLHELVHHMQYEAEVKIGCHGRDIETPAYEVQIAWLEASGVADPYELIGTDKFTLAVYRMCEPF